MALTINGRSLSSMGLSAAKLSGWLDGPTVKRGATGLSNVLGVVPDLTAVAEPRTMRVTLNVAPSALTDRPTVLASLQDAFAGLLSVRTDDAPGRVIRATADAFAVAAVDERISMTTGGKNLLAALTLTAWDGVSYDAEPSLLLLGTTAATATRIPLGSLPSPGVVQWSGSWSEGVARTLTYRSVNGITYGTLTITPPVGSGGLASGDYLEIDLGRRYLTKVTTSARTNAYSWKSGGSWFVPDALDTDRRASVWPTLDVSAGVALFLYRRVWAL